MQQQLPQKYKAVYLEAPGKQLEVRELDLPTLVDDNDILVKVEAAPINPSDSMYMLGLYNSPKKYPCTPGFEGAGIVVQAKGDKAQGLLGKKVSFLPKDCHFTGSYGEYCVSTLQQAVLVADDIPFEIAASNFVNPYTVVCMLNLVKKSGVKTVVHTAAASQLGRMMNKYFNKNGIEVINVVRKQEQIDILKQLGAKYILNLTDSDFQQQLTKLSSELQATIAFECIGGDISGQIVSALPNDSTVYVYGCLSGQNPSNIPVGDLIFKGKTLTGYWLSKDLHPSKNNIVEVAQTVSSLLQSDFKTDIGKDFSFEHANEAVKYYQQNATLGKPILKYNGTN